MFESVSPAPGPDGLTRAARIFYVVSVLTALGNSLSLVLAIIDRHSVSPVRPTLRYAFAILALLTGRGIEGQRIWAKWMGYALGALELFSFPIGTIIGIAVLVYIRRADKAGLFSIAA